MITIETKSGKKAYETVAERVKKFRATYPVDSGWQLLTEIEFPRDGLVLCRAKIVDPNGRLVATGTAEEVRGSTLINKTSAVENAETSAIGRALFAAGFGGGEFCSADELMAALKRQEELVAAENQARRMAGGKSSSLSAQDQPFAPRAARKEQEPHKQSMASTGEPVVLSPEPFGFSEESGIDFFQEGDVIQAKDRRKGATFSNREALKSAGFAFDGHQRVWFKKVADEAA
jgi:hypothetical protein